MTIHKMKSVTILLSVTLLLLIVSCSGTPLYNFDLNDPNNKVLLKQTNRPNQPHFKINAFPGTTDTTYRGELYPDLDSNPNIIKHVLIPSHYVFSQYEPAMWNPPIASSYNPTENEFLVIPAGKTFVYSDVTQQKSSFLFLVHGTFTIDQTKNFTVYLSRMVLMPGSVFNATTSPNQNVTFSFYQHGNAGRYPWDATNNGQVLCLGCTFIIKGSDPRPSVYGSTYTPYYNTSPRPYKGFTKNWEMFPTGKSVFQYNGPYLIYPDNLEHNSETVSVLGQDTAGPYFNDNQFKNGHLMVTTQHFNLGFTAWQSYGSFVLTGPCTVSIENAVFHGMGFTSSAYGIDNTVVDSTYKVTYHGWTPAFRHPITLIDVSNPVLIKNNAFLSTSYYIGSVALAHIYVRRSFGEISYNGFVTGKNLNTTGIIFGYGTEQFNVSGNGFLSSYDDTRGPVPELPWPIVGVNNHAIYSVSPFIDLNNNYFDGRFVGGAVVLRPLQDRAAKTGLAQDTLVGIYDGIINPNDNYINNAQWQLMLSNINHNWFFRESEFRIIYSAMPQLKVKFNNCRFIRYQHSLKIPPTNPNVDLEFFESDFKMSMTPLEPTILNCLSMKKFYHTDLIYFNSTSFLGNYNGFTIINAPISRSANLFARQYTTQPTVAFHTKFLGFHNLTMAFGFSTEFTLDLWADEIYFMAANLSRVTDVKDNEIGYSQKLAKSPFWVRNVAVLPVGDAATTTTFNIQNIESSFYDYYMMTNYSVTVNGERKFSQGLVFVDHADVLQQFAISKVRQSQYESIEMERNGRTQLILNTQAEFYQDTGGYFATTFEKAFDSQSFYLGISFAPVNSPTELKRSLSVFGNQWTKCHWLAQQMCRTTGLLSKQAVAPASITNLDSSLATTNADEIEMLSNYLLIDKTNPLTPVYSTVKVNLPYGYYRIFLYVYNDDTTYNSPVTPLPVYTVKVNGKYDTVYSRFIPPVGKYQKLGPYYWNNYEANADLEILWAVETTAEVKLSGIEIFSGKVPYPIPIDPIPTETPTQTPTPTPTNGANVPTTTSPATTTSGQETTSSPTVAPGSNISMATTLYQINSSFGLISLIVVFLISLL